MTDLLPISDCRKILTSSSKSVKEKYSALYHLRTYANKEAFKVLREVYPGLNSDLLEHELMFILGQIRIDSSLDYLISILEDKTTSAVVRHEAGEALSNFMKYKDKILPILEKYKNDTEPLVAQTAKIASLKLQNSHLQERYGVFIDGSLEPAAPFSEEELMEFLHKNNYIEEGEFFIWPMILEIDKDNVEDLIQKLAKPLDRMLFDDSLEEFFKYRLLYLFRNKADVISIIMLTKMMEKQHRQKSSTLLRHEVTILYLLENSGV